MEPERYWQSGWFDTEIASIFLSQSFVAHESDLPGDDDYFSYRLGKKNLSLRRDAASGAMRLFENVCRHRFNLIDPPGFGNRPFRCGSHGWQYRSDGCVSFIPMRDSFADLPSTIQLPEFATQDIAGFQFLLGPALGAQRCPDIEHMLSELGTPHSEPFYKGELEHSCNWKLLVENTLEGYHLSTVHANTFGKSGFTTTSKSVGSETVHESLLTTFPHDEFAKKMVAFLPGSTPAHRHLYVFPNLFVSITNDLVYLVSNFVPTSASSTMLHYRLFATSRMKALRPAVQRHLQSEAVAFTHAAMAEDKAIVESNQIGITGVEGEYFLSAREARIDHFHNIYDRYA